MNTATNILSGNMFKTSIILFFISSLIIGLVKKLRKLFTKNKKLAIFYALFILLTFALTGLLSWQKVLNDSPLNSFIGIQFVFLLLGLIHLYILNTFFPELSNEDSNFFGGFLFTLAVMCIGFIAFSNVVNTFRPAFSFTFLGSGLFFLIPFLIKKLYDFAINIPVPIYKKWLYPLNPNFKDPTQNELTNPAVISFEFQKKHEDDDITNFRIKAPENMEFGKLFYFFINDYNTRHPEDTIEFLDEQTQQPYEWIFYFKPNWLGNLNHIDFSKTVLNNTIRENSVIVCQRF